MLVVALVFLCIQLIGFLLAARAYRAQSKRFLLEDRLRSGL